MRTAVLMGLCCLLIACAASRPASRPDTGVAGAADTARDGSSFEQAIVIQASNETDGIAQEYRWIEKHYPGYRRGMQSLASHEGRAYDILQFTDAQGASHEVYFDITSFFGKW